MLALTKAGALAFVGGLGTRGRLKISFRWVWVKDDESGRTALGPLGFESELLVSGKRMKMRFGFSIFLEISVLSQAIAEPGQISLYHVNTKEKLENFQLITADPEHPERQWISE